MPPKRPASAPSAAHRADPVDIQFPPRLGRTSLKERRRRAFERRVAPGGTHPSHLWRSSVTPHTLALYDTAARDFQRSTGMVLRPGVVPKNLDRKLAAYVHERYLVGDSYAVVNTAVHGVLFRMCVRMRDVQLPLTKAAFRGFRRLVPENSRDPLPWQAVLHMAYWLVSMRADLTGAFQAAIAMLLQFDTYARPGAILQIGPRQLIPPMREVPSKEQVHALVLAPSDEGKYSKTRTQDDTILIGTMNSGREWINNVVAALRPKLYRGRGVFTITLSQYNLLMKKAAIAMGLAHLPVSPHCIRHGGPSQDYYNGVRTLKEIKLRGCWSADRSVARYKKPGRLLRQINNLTVSQRLAAPTHERWLSEHLPVIVLEEFRLWFGVPEPRPPASSGSRWFAAPSTGAASSSSRPPAPSSPRGGHRHGRGPPGL